MIVLFSKAILLPMFVNGDCMAVSTYFFVYVHIYIVYSILYHIYHPWCGRMCSKRDAFHFLWSHEVYWSVFCIDGTFTISCDKIINRKTKLRKVKYLSVTVNVLILYYIRCLWPIRCWIRHLFQACRCFAMVFTHQIWWMERQNMGWNKHPDLIASWWPEPQVMQSYNCI
jgi:hypothetical protein